VVRQRRVVRVVSAVTHREENASDETTLRNAVGPGLHEIPAKPLHLKDGVVANPELESEPHGHERNQSQSPCFLNLLNLSLSLMKQIKLVGRRNAQSVELISLLSDNSILEKQRLLLECLADLIRSNALAEV
jgi:hypothetical protein